MRFAALNAYLRKSKKTRKITMYTIRAGDMTMLKKANYNNKLSKKCCRCRRPFQSDNNGNIGGFSDINVAMPEPARCTEFDFGAEGLISCFTWVS